MRLFSKYLQFCYRNSWKSFCETKAMCRKRQWIPLISLIYFVQEAIKGYGQRRNLRQKSAEIIAFNVNNIYSINVPLVYYRQPKQHNFLHWVLKLIHPVISDSRHNVKKSSKKSPMAYVKWLATRYTRWLMCLFVSCYQLGLTVVYPRLTYHSSHVRREKLD